MNLQLVLGLLLLDSSGLYDEKKKKKNIEKKKSIT